jgi:hypothetical protein
MLDGRGPACAAINKCYKFYRKGSYLESISEEDMMVECRALGGVEQ